MRFLKQNTATRITVGPFLDKTDGITPEVALTVTSEKLTFVVDTAGVPTLVLDVAPTASGGANDMVHITGDDAGYYDLELAAANVNYVGPAFLSINDVATHLPVFHEFMILPANIYDSIVGGTDVLDVSATQILGTAISTPATAGVLDVNIKNIANAVVNTATAQVGANVVSQANIDFGALQKASIETACDATVGGGTGTALTAIPWNAAWDAEVQSEAQDAITASALATAAALATVDDFLDTEVAAILAAVDTEIGTLTTEVGKIPKSDGTSSWNATALAAIQSECNDALVAYDPPTKAELDAAQAAVTVSAIGANVITAASMNADAGTEIAAAVWAKTGTVTSIATELLLERLYEMINNKMIITEATGAVALRNLADSADVATGNVQDLGATTQRNALTWV